MSPQGAGNKKTPKTLVILLSEAVAKTSQSAVARDTGLTQSAIGRYIKGIGEPTTATLQKLADYFGVTVAELRGDVSRVDTDFEDYVVLRQGGPRGFVTNQLSRFEKILKEDISTAAGREGLQEEACTAEWILYAPEPMLDVFKDGFGTKWEILSGRAKQVIDKNNTMLKECTPKERKRLMSLRQEFEKSRCDAAPGFILDQQVMVPDGSEPQKIS